MKKYFLSHIDFSEVVNVTADEKQLSRARARMKALKLLTDKGKPLVSAISLTANTEAGALINKLRKRLRRRGGVRAVNATLHMLYDRKDYYGFFLYLAFLYGFLEWQLPEKLTLLPAAPVALKCYCGEFLAAVDKYQSGGKETESVEPVDDEYQDDI